MSRRLLAQLAIGLPAAVALLAVTATPGFAQPETELVVSTTLSKKTSNPAPVGNAPGISISKSPAETLFANLSDSSLTSLEQITFSPAGSAGCTRSCDDTASATYLATFKVYLSSSPTDYTTLTDDVTFVADYSNLTDSVSWANAEANEPYCTPYKDDGTTTDDCALLQTVLSNGDTLDLILNDAADWDITSDISVELAPPPPPPPPPGVPEPAPIALLFAGMLGVGIARRLRFGKQPTQQS